MLAVIFMKFKYLLFLLLFASVKNGFSQRHNKFILEQKQIDSIGKPIDSILIIGIGSSTTRIFLDDLSQSVINRLTDDSIVAHYLYLGKTSTEAQSALDTVNKKGYNAILFFFPQGSSFYDVQGSLNQTTANTRLGPITTIAAFSRIDYQQDFNLQLCIQDSEWKQIWTASLEVAGDLRKPKNAKNIAARLLSYFKTNHYIN
jgi:hypothetical protein